MNVVAFVKNAVGSTAAPSARTKISVLMAAVAALIVGHVAEGAAMESTSATTTYHRVTVDGVGVF